MAAGGFAVFAILDGRRRRLNEQAALQSAQLGDIRTRQQHLAEQDARAIAVRELIDENADLKKDIFGLDVANRKLKLDQELQKKSQEALNAKTDELGSKYMKETVKWIASSLRPDNYGACKQRLLDAIERCREIGCEITKAQEFSLLSELKADYERVVKASLEREEQARIRAQIREEQQRERDAQRELDQLDRERAAIQAALAKALADAHDQYSAEVEALKARLAYAEEQSRRAIAQAQLTKSGHVYVISNIGSFGSNVFKIGMTRRLEPLERIKELGDASVPFPFDIHMMISCDDAPALEHTIHRALVKHQINRVNPRKEFFRIDLDAIRQIVEEHHGVVEYRADAEALQYNQSLSISEEDQEFIERVYDKVDEDHELDEV